MLVLVAGCGAERDTLKDTQPDRGPGSMTGELAEPESEKEITVGSSGDTATLERDEHTLTPESNVEAARMETGAGEDKRGEVAQWFAGRGWRPPAGSRST